MTQEHYSDALALVLSVFLFFGVLGLGSRMSTHLAPPSQSELSSDYQQLREQLDETKRDLTQLEGRTALYLARAEELAAR